MSKTTNYAGIDYGLNQTNKSKSTGIRFGVISQHSCDPEALDWSGGFDAAWDAAYEQSLTNAKAESEANGEEFDEDAFEPWIEDAGFLLKNNEYAIESCLQTDLIIVKSPFFTYAQLCSPCVPGACNLDSPLDEPIENNRCYCLGHDWFNGNKAPYPVYSVESGQPVLPK